MEDKICYTLYKTTNLINNKIYIGVHKTQDPNDLYLGSGIGLKRAIQKYGKDNVKKEILFVSNSEEDIFELENFVVDIDFIERRDTYNMKLGGEGGWPKINISEDRKELTRIRMLGNTYSRGYKQSQETKEKISKALLGNQYAKGNILSDETRQKMSASRAGIPKSDKFKDFCRNKMLDPNNPMFSRESVIKREATKKRNRELKKLASENGLADG